MPSPDKTYRLDQDDELTQISRRRSRVAILLTTMMIVIYFTFMTLFAFAKPTMGMLLTNGLSLCILLGASVIIASFGLCLVYVVWANRVYDPAVRRIIDRGASHAGR